VILAKETIGEATLYLGDCLAVIPELTAPIDALFTDPPYSSGGQFRGDRMAQTSAKYQGSEHRDLYDEFSGDNRDQRSFGYWSALWLTAIRERAAPDDAGIEACGEQARSDCRPSRHHRQERDVVRRHGSALARLGAA
jgi:hypothetical protein